MAGVMPAWRSFSWRSVAKFSATVVRKGTCWAWFVSSAQGLRRLTFLVNQLERIIFVGDDLLVLEEFDEAVIGHVLETRVGPATKENSQADESESDGDENDTAPVKARLVSARFIFFLRIAIRLGHEIESPFLSGAKR